MCNLKLVFPTVEYEQEAINFIQEFRDNGSNINGVGGLDRYANYSEWIIKLQKDLDINNIEPGRVPGSTYFAIREEDSRIVGMINIRHQLNDYLLQHGGHIGYGVRPTERKKGYATEILYLGLQKCDELGIDKVLLTCDKVNLGSARTIQNNCGILENEFYDEEDKEIVQRYWINVKEALLKRQQQELGKKNSSISDCQYQIVNIRFDKNV